MGIYLNPGNGMFQKSLDSAIYVDKSGLIEKASALVGTRDCYLCVSRPRRFGKTMALDMLAAYYGRGCDSHAQFEGLAISSSDVFGRHLNKYDVIKVTMTNFLTRGGGTVRGAICLLEELVKDELAHAFPDARVSSDHPLSVWLERVYGLTAVPFVFLIDEWDCVMREFQGDESAQKEYLDWLRDLLKDQEYVGLAYATGILPVKKYGQHSALNMFDEVTVLDARPFSEFTGFTEAEVEALCVRYGADMDEMRRWYDGYCVDGLSIYNPRSVVASLAKGAFGNYWTRTETFEALRRYVMLDMGGLRGKVVELISGGEVAVNVDKFANDMTTFRGADDVLTLLVHLGYLTYDASARVVRVPNSEVAHEFASSVEDDVDWKPLADAIADSERAWAALLSGDVDLAAELVGRSHADAASALAYNDENSLACAVSLAFYAARRSHLIEREAPAGKGFADVVFRPRPGVSAPAVVVELKAGGAPEDALEQIRRKGYADALSAYPEVVLVGMSYDPDSKSPGYKDHRCAIERL